MSTIHQCSSHRTQEYRASDQKHHLEEADQGMTDNGMKPNLGDQYYKYVQELKRKHKQ